MKAQINFIKDIAYRIAQGKAGDMLVNCIKAVKEKDKNILNNMSYYDTTKPKEV